MSEDIPQWLKILLTILIFGFWPLLRIAAESDAAMERAWWRYQVEHNPAVRARVERLYRVYLSRLAREAEYQAAREAPR